MTPICWPNGHEMALKDEKECFMPYMPYIFECQICFNEKEGGRWRCQSCWDEDEDEKCYCLECITDIGNHDHTISNKTVK